MTRPLFILNLLCPHFELCLLTGKASAVFPHWTESCDNRHTAPLTQLAAPLLLSQPLIGKGRMSLLAWRAPHRVGLHFVGKSIQLAISIVGGGHWGEPLTRNGGQR